MKFDSDNDQAMMQIGQCWLLNGSCCVVVDLSLVDIMVWI